MGAFVVPPGTSLIGGRSSPSPMVATPRDDKADVFIHRLTLSNLLSFGPRKTDVQLGPLNVLIGPNGSGKSSLIAAIELLRAAPRDLVAPIREGGGISEWLHKSTSRARKGSVETAVDFPLPSGPLRYHLTVEEQLHRFHSGTSGKEGCRCNHGA